MLFKRKQTPIKIRKMALPDVITQATGQKRLTAEFKQRAKETFKQAGLNKSLIDDLLSGRHKLGEQEMKRICGILANRRVKGLGGHTSGSSLVNAYIKHQELKQKRIRAFGARERSEEKELDLNKHKTSALSRQGPTTSIASHQGAATGALERKIFSTNKTKSATQSSSRVNLPF